MSAFQRPATGPSRPGLIEGAAVALVLSVSGAALLVLAPRGTGGDGVWTLAAAVIGLSYLGYLLARAPSRTGRVSAALAAITATGFALLLGAAPQVMVLLQAGSIWLVRGLFFHSRPLAVLVDGALLGIGLLVGAWAALRTGSPLLSLWSLFLIQSLFVLIPGAQRRAETSDGAFERAYQRAEQALARLEQGNPGH